MDGILLWSLMWTQRLKEKLLMRQQVMGQPPAGQGTQEGQQKGCCPWAGKKRARKA